MLVEYEGADGELRIEGWKDGDADINAEVRGEAKTTGWTLGVQSDAISLARSSSASTIKGEIEGSLSDNTYSSKIRAFILFQDRLIIDSKLHIQLYYNEIECILATNEGVVIETAETTYRTTIKKHQTDLDAIEQFVTTRIERSGQNPNISESTADKLRQLKQLREEGVLTEEEYKSKKEELLDGF